MRILLSLVCMIGLYQTASAVTLRSAYKSNLCIDVNRSEFSDWRYETNVEVWPCHGNENQQFILKPASVNGNNLSFTISSLGKCLDIDLGYLDSWTHKSNVQVFSCNDGVNQQFRLEPQGGGWFLIRSQLDGRCLDIDLNSATGWRYERNVQLWNCNGGSNQLWKFASGDGDVIIIPGF